MRLSNNLMPGSGVPVGSATRSQRNDWAKSIEGKVRSLCPLPITYDVDSTQPVGFSEFSYTEFLGGLYLNTQSVEINARLVALAAQVHTDFDHTNLLATTEDKYELDKPDTLEWPKKVGFMVGHNMFDLVSSEVLARTAFENPDFRLKPHPLTNSDYAGRLAHLIGWDRMLASNLSGVALLANCEDAYVSTATELCALGVAKGKRVHNLSSFFNESSGVYYPINRLLFRAENPKQVLNNIVECRYSGVLFDWMGDLELRIANYFKKALELRDQFRPISSPTRLLKIPVSGANS